MDRAEATEAEIKKLAVLMFETIQEERAKDGQLQDDDPQNFSEVVAEDRDMMLRAARRVYEALGYRGHGEDRIVVKD